MREADILQKQISGFETQVLEKMTTVEEVEKVLADRATDEISSIETDREKTLAVFDKELEKQRKEFESESKKRQKFLSLCRRIWQLSMTGWRRAAATGLPLPKL